MSDAAHQVLTGPAATRAYADLLWAPHPWPTGTVLVAGSFDGASKFAVEHLPVDKEALVSWADRAGADRAGRTLAVGIGPRNAGVGTGRRGGTSDIVGLPAVWVDIDTVEGHHATATTRPLPTLAQAADMLDQAVAPPSFTVFSGGGIHAYWLLAAPVAATHPLIRIWRNYWQQLAADTGLDVDLSAMDAARSLRLPGTVNRKGGGAVPTELRLPAGNIVYYQADTLIDLIPGVPADPSTPKPARVDPDDNRPGSVLARELPVTDILETVEGWSRVGERDDCVRWHVPGGTSDERESHAESFHADDDGVVRVVGYSPRVQDYLGRDGQTPISSWQLICGHYCGGNTKTASGLATLFVTLPADQRADIILGLLSTADTPDLLAEAVSNATRELIGADITSPAGGDGSVRQPTMAAAIAAFDGTVIPNGPGMYAVVGGDAHGVWEMVDEPVPGGKGTQAVPRQLLDWVPWVSARIVLQASPDPKDVEVTYQVEIVDRHGGRDKLELKKEVYLSIAALQTESRLKLHIPEERGKKAVSLRNFINSFLGDECVEQTVYAQTGWNVLDGKHIFAAPAGTVTADGIIQVPFSTATVQEQAIGFPSLPDDVRPLAGAICDLIAVVEDMPELGVSLIGAIFGAPLRMSRRGSVMVVGEAGSGKSVMARFSTAFLSSTSPSDGFIDLKSASVAGTHTATRWFCDLPLIADDFRRPSSKTARERAINTLGVIVNCGYSDLGELKATADGRRRKTYPTHTFPIITGEDSPDEEDAMKSRIVPVFVAKSTIDKSDKGGLQRFASRWVTASPRPPVNELYGAYLSWLAGQLDNGGSWCERKGLDGLREASDRYRTDWYQAHAKTRASEIVAAVATGWAALRAFAVDAGFADLLPSESQLGEVLDRMASETEKQNAETSTLSSILDWAGSALASGQVVVVGRSGDAPPDDLAFQLGWRMEQRGWVRLARADELGVLADDDPTRPAILIRESNLRDVAARCPQTSGLSAAQVVRMARSTWKSRRSRAHLCGNLCVRGYKFFLDELVSDDGDETEGETGGATIHLLPSATVPAEVADGARPAGRPLPHRGTDGPDVDDPDGDDPDGEEDEAAMPEEDLPPPRRSHRYGFWNIEAFPDADFGEIEL